MKNWTVSPADSIYSPDRFQVIEHNTGDCPDRFVCVNVDRHTADLAAAAPDMLQACYDALNAMSYNLTHDNLEGIIADAAGILDAAIARAEGNTL